MISLELDVVQYDCPYIDTTDARDVSFFVKQWDFNPATEQLETRIMVRGKGPGAVAAGLDELGAHDNMEEYELLKRTDDRAIIRSRIGMTDAMRVIREHDGYITGPFHIEAGSELWRVGFDTEATAHDALAALDRNNDFTVEQQEPIDVEDFYDLLQHADTMTGLLDGVRELSETERETLLHAVDAGYFTTPRDATLSSLAEEFGVSKTAVSKNLRRSQRKVLDRVSTALSEFDRIESPEPVTRN